MTSSGAGDSFGASLPALRCRPPGPASKAFARRLREVESRNVTWVSDSWPVFWEEAAGANVRDADGNVFLDLTGAFGVALLGHAHPAVVSAVREQAGRLLHGMGDVHPPVRKLELLERLAALMPFRRTRGVLASTGAEAVEIALKTAWMATGRRGVIAFEGAYHGLTLGALSATSRSLFRGPFEARLPTDVAFAPFPDPRVEGSAEASLRVVELMLRDGVGGSPVGAILVEPVQGRAGARVPPAGFLRSIGARAHAAGALVVADEVLTGMGRCGALLASWPEGLAPDLVCVGKALGGGLPLSACLGEADVFDAWPESGGEAIHTSTFLGHPLACAASLAAVGVLEREGVPARAEAEGVALREALGATVAGGRGRVREVRGRGLLIGIELSARGEAVRVAEEALGEGILVLPAGEDGRVLELTPPVGLTGAQRDHAVRVLARLLGGGRA